MIRYKKTGKIINGCFVVCEYKDGARFSVNDKPVYDSLSELNEDYEDVKEPLIKDEKIRKAVRAWAKANEVRRVYIIDLGLLRDESTGNEIKFNGEPFVGWVTALKTITELCGEED